MSKSPRVALILPDALQCVGLRCLLTDYCSPVEIELFASFEAFRSAGSDYFDFYFTLPDTFVLHPDFFLPKRTKTVCIINKCTREENHGSDVPILQVNLSHETIVEQLRYLMKTAGRLSHASGSDKELSAREKEVLSLIVKGLINKEIADKLYISLNTVLTHRKNITSKLGIKTVPGLTFYAITNGIS